MSKEIRRKLLIPNVHMDARLFSGPDRALIGRNRHDEALQVVAYFSLPVRTIVKKQSMALRLHICTKELRFERGCSLAAAAAAPIARKRVEEAHRAFTRGQDAIYKRSLEWRLATLAIC